MNRLLIAAIGAASLVSNAVTADDAHHPEAKKPVAESKARPPTAKPAQAGSMAMMEKMKTMKAQMEKMRATTDPKEREVLMREHMKSMQDAMVSMRGMGGGMMGGAGSKSGTASMHASMEQRMDMMQMMMEQMMEHQKAMQGPN